MYRIFEGNLDVISYLQRAVGYSLTGSCKEQVMFLLLGQGSNGKSVFQETIGAVLGEYSTSSQPDLILVDKFGKGAPDNMVARLKGPRTVMCNEIPQHAKLNEAKVKEMTGEDTLTARFLYKEAFTFKPQFKLWVRSNNKPDISGVDHGIWRRIHMVTFPVRFTEEEKDKDLMKKLIAEAPGILAWAVRGCLEWQRIGLYPPASIAEEVRDYQREMDSLSEWIEDFCHVETHAECAANRLYESYSAWAKSQGARINSARWLGLALRDRHFKREKRRDGRYYLGIRLRPEVIQSSGGASLDASNFQDDMPF